MGWRTICPGDRDDHITRFKDCFEGTDDLPTRPLGINVYVRGDLATGKEGRLLFCIHEELKLITCDEVAVGRCASEAPMVLMIAPYGISAGRDA